MRLMSELSCKMPRNRYLLLINAHAIVINVFSRVSAMKERQRVKKRGGESSGWHGATIKQRLGKQLL